MGLVLWDLRTSFFFFFLDFLFRSWANLTSIGIDSSKPGGKSGLDEDDDDDLELGLRSAVNLFEVWVKIGEVIFWAWL